MPIIKNARSQAEAWEWFNAHKKDKIFHIKKWWLRWKVKVKQLRPFMVILFGEPQ